jgi:uncharacterized membrane protein
VRTPAIERTDQLPPRVDTGPRPPRQAAVDKLRGAVIVLMVLDHARDFFCSLAISPTDLAATSVPLFLTRWVTHLCAPVFVLLAGTAAYLRGRGQPREALSGHLVRRGLFLVLLELTIVRLCLVPDLGYHLTVLSVLWALGWSMVALAILIRLPAAATVAVGLALVAGHNLLDGVRVVEPAALAALWKVLHQPGFIPLAAGHVAVVGYPLLPWIGVMALGHGLGRIIDDADVARRRRRLLSIGLGALLAFFLLRGWNLYGDPRPWMAQPRGAVFTVLSFFNTEKYPPSLLFLLMTLGPALCALALLDRRPAQGSAASGPAGEPGQAGSSLLARPLLVFGRVPLFFFVTHLVLLRLASAPFAALRWGPTAFALPPAGHAGNPEFPLWVAYPVWAATLLVLYPLCRWFMTVKSRRRGGWLSYV